MYLQVHNYGLMNLGDRIYLYVIVRNENSGTIQVTSKTAIRGSSTSGGIDNIGHFICKANFDRHCEIGVPFRNYRHLELESGDLRLESKSQLIDGCKVTGPGQLTFGSELQLGGMSYSNIQSTGAVYITAPFFSYGTFHWTSGSLKSTTDDCRSSYSVTNYLNPLCEEAYFMNEGLMVISGNDQKLLSSKSLLVNRGRLSWSAYGKFYIVRYNCKR